MNKIKVFAFVVAIINLLVPAYTQAASVEQTHAFLHGTWSVDLAETKTALLAPNYLTPEQKQSVVLQLTGIGVMEMAFTDAGLEVDSSFGNGKPMLYQLDKSASSPKNLIYRSTTQPTALAVAPNGSDLLTITEHRDHQDISSGFVYARWSRSTPSSKSPEQRSAEYQSGYLVWLSEVRASFISQTPAPPPNLDFDAKALYNEFVNESPNAFNDKQQNKIVVVVRPVVNSNDTPQTDIGLRLEGYPAGHVFGLRVLGTFDNSLVGKDVMFAALESNGKFPNRQQTAPHIYSANKKCVTLSGLSSCPGLVCFLSRNECSMITLKIDNYNEIEAYASKMQK
ncbi:MAG: hypothetical protein PHZ02_12580 [Desulfocapsaceae bacterium]|nr:hypothetical protein [Desulfocapsaceae bacterium]